MRAVQHSEHQVERQLDLLAALPEQRREQQSTGYPA